MKKEYLVSANEMKQMDDNTIKKTGIPSLVLMERAAYETASCVMEYYKHATGRKTVVIAGNGNNGADGVCAGRILKEYGYDVEVCLLKSTHDYTDELKLQIEIASKYNIPFLQEEELDFDNYSVIIDAIFGIGLSRNIEGQIKDIILEINDSGCHVISVDIPSGVNATTGKICNVAVRANTTVTFGYYKSGQFLYPGRDYCGIIKKVYIGIDDTSLYGMIPSMFTYLATDEKIDFDRSSMGNKGTFGKVFVVAGRASTAGAALLCASSAIRSGCGMVAVMTEDENKSDFLANLPETMLETYNSQTKEAVLSEKLDKWLAWADVVVIGCGLGTDKAAYYILEHTIKYCNKPIVCDADALQLLATDPVLKNSLVENNISKKRDVIFTPHPKELATLANCSVLEVKENRIQIAQEVCRAYHVTVIAKDADTLCIANMKQHYLNITGNDGMSTAGSGDVLAGLAASFIAQSKSAGMDIFEAVCLAVHVHGYAGDYQAKKNGKRFMVASDIVEAYKYILK